MNVYAESNFILELALKRDQWQSCQAIIGLAQASGCDLFLPSWSFVEPYRAITTARGSRKQALQSMATQVNELSRSEHFQHLRNRFQAVQEVFIESEQLADEGLESARRLVRSAAHILPITGDVLLRADDWRPTLVGKEVDAVMLATVYEHARARRSPSVFLNRNSKDFDDPLIVKMLAEEGCRLCFNFDEGLQLLRPA